MPFRPLLPIAVLMLAAAAPAAAQQADTTEYVVLRGADTVVTERVIREGVTRKGVHTVRAAAPRITSWSIVLDPEGAAALVEATETQPSSDPKMKGRVLHRTRVIFKADSAAVDDMTSNGMMTDIYPTRAGAVPYLNLSTGMLEAAIQRALRDGKSQGEVPLFNLGGAQTAVATVKRTSESGVALTVGTVVFDAQMDAKGQVATVSIPSQNVRIARR